MANSRATSPRRLAYTALQRIERDQAYSDLVLAALLKQSSLDTRDRAFINDLVRGTVCWKNRLNFIVDQLFSGKELPNEIRWLLWLALYQIDYMNVPDHAAVNEAVDLTRSLKFARWSGVVNGILRNYQRHPERIQYPGRKQNPIAYISVRFSHPAWLVERWLQQWGFDKTIALCESNNQIPPLCVRVNTEKIAPKDFKVLLEKKMPDACESVLSDYYRLQNIQVDMLHAWLDKGWITVQDESAGLIGLAINPEPGMMIFDACAAPGGKSMHLAELSGNRAQILSADLQKQRTGLIALAAKRLDHSSVVPLVADANHIPIKQADVILLDAPCSGLGVLRRKPDMRWRRTLEEMQQLPVLQTNLLTSAAKHVKIGGHLVYSTCTIDPHENENVIKTFLESHKNYELESFDDDFWKPFLSYDGYIRTWPDIHGMDGSFLAKLKRTA